MYAKASDLTPGLIIDFADQILVISEVSRTADSVIVTWEIPQDSPNIRSAVTVPSDYDIEVL